MIIPIVINPPGANINIKAGVKLAGTNEIPNTDPLPKISLIAPKKVKDKVNQGNQDIKTEDLLWFKIASHENLAGAKEFL